MADISPGQFRNLFNQRPMDPAVMMAAGRMLIQQKHFAAAYHILSRAVDRDPCEEARLHFGLAQMQLSATTGQLHWLDRARECFTDAMNAFPESSHARKCLAIAHLEAGEFTEARLFITQSIAMEEDQPDAHFTLAQIEFLAGNWPEGWAALDRFNRARQEELTNGLPYRSTERSGLLVRGKGGIGDEIMLASMVPDLQADGLDFTLMCEPRLMGLFARSFPGLRLVGPQAAPESQGIVTIVGAEPAYSAECFIASLGGEYRKTSGSFPRTPFLNADIVRCVHWRETLDALPGKKVGIAWAGGPAMNWTRRSLTVDELVPLMQIPGVTWVTLEYLDPASSIAALQRHGINVVEFPSATRAGVDYDETAALVSELDAVVTVTTAVAHLAGAIGVRAHVMVPRVPRWWYSAAGPDHPWYGSLVLHRQDDSGRWPIEDVRTALIRDLGTGEGNERQMLADMGVQP